MKQRSEAGIGAVGPLVKVTWNDAAAQIKVYRINALGPNRTSSSM